MLEAELEQLITMEAVKYGAVLMRNNSGAMTDSTGRTVRYGLDNTSKKRNEEIKSSDRIGFTQVVITPAMVGSVVAVFTAIECKRPGWKAPMNARERAQAVFINWIKMRGGISGFVSSVEELVVLLKCK